MKDFYVYVETECLQQARDLPTITTLPSSSRRKRKSDILCFVKLKLAPTTCDYVGSLALPHNRKNENIIIRQNNDFIPFSSLSQLITEAKQMIEHLVTKDFTISFEIPQQGRVFGEQDIPEGEIIER